MTSSAPALEMVDYRKQARPLPILQRILADATAEQIQVWAEAEAYSRLRETWGDAIHDRDRLSPCETLVIWTSPPGAAELREVLANTRPSRVIVFAVDPSMDQLQPFLQRLAGLVKHDLAKPGGWINPSRLAGATAQQVWAAQLGVEWLAANGHLSIINKKGEMNDLDLPEEVQDGMQIMSGGETNPLQAEALLEQIKNAIAETRAYRAYFSSHDPLVFDV